MTQENRTLNDVLVEILLLHRELALASTRFTLAGQCWLVEMHFSVWCVHTEKKNKRKQKVEKLLLSNPTASCLSLSLSTCYTVEEKKSTTVHV